MDLLVAAALLSLFLVLAFFLFRGKKAPIYALKGSDVPVSLRLREVIPITHNTKTYRFDLPCPSDRLGLPIGKHFSTFAIINGEEVHRPYTPTSSDDEIGYVDLVIKVYEQGMMSRHIDSLRVGDELVVKGPKGLLEYQGLGSFKISGKPLANYNKVNMICGGTGITPMLQVIRAVFKNPEDRTGLRMIFGNITEEDILLRQELDAFAANPQLRVHYTLDKPSSDWTMGIGYVTPEMMTKQLYPPSAETITLLCGPKPMVDASKRNLETLGHERSSMFAF